MSAPGIPCQSSICPNGHPASTLECPTCHKLGIKGSFFCGQECFKAGCEQKTHKLIHELATRSDPNVNIAYLRTSLTCRPSDGTFNPFASFNFSGKMRPAYPLSPRRPVPDYIQRPDYAEDGQPISENRRAGQPVRILTKEEQEKMRTVCRLAREVLDIAAAAVRPGITTDEIDEIVHNAIIERNAYPSPLNYRGFPKSVCTSVNEVICHGIPDKRKLQEGDIVNLDVTLYYDGFHGDLNETYPVGHVSEGAQKLMRVTRQCLDEAIKICKPGALFRDLGKIIEPIARGNNCAVVRTYCGHGIHELFHCAPNVPHYSKNKAIGTMKPGMVFTIEPMINLGHNWDVMHWPDEWTATTVDGKLSAQFEDTLLITETGVENLTAGKRRADLYD
ncbi:methionine aminopeptidase [Laetiporus sulphureus 93-53]|uniref:Methionine aminopeptidase n=1 Tax=Laetiporus sulphureus 93-53 TaxID=1314785 RepID=A0A165H8D0_9APHY|nr:methionine aminopeptidase [Laetiporus sulphureus 93-53]KZT11386.1 methionine aminopeptidase [Laetiporus sulphureus 93-53]